MRTDLEGVMPDENSQEDAITLIRNTGYFVKVEETEDGWLVNTPRISILDKSIEPLQTRFVLQEDSVIEFVVGCAGEPVVHHIPLYGVAALVYARLNCVAYLFGMEKGGILSADPELRLYDTLSIYFEDDEFLDKQDKLWQLVDKTIEEGFTEKMFREAEQVGLLEEYQIIANMVSGDQD